MVADQKKDKLLPCPFCGGEPEEQRHPSYHPLGTIPLRSIWCKRCGCSTSIHNKLETAIQAWNKRINKEESRVIILDELDTGIS